MILHTINKPAALAQCEALIAEGDAVVLIEDGVYLALQSLPFPVRVMDGDAEARGITAKLNRDQMINYAGLVDLSVQADKICAWF